MTHPGSAVAPETAPAGAVEPASLLAAREWLALVDTGQYSASWMKAGRLTREEVPQEKWAEEIDQLRRRAGFLQERKFLSKSYRTRLLGERSGEYVVVKFRSSFDIRRNTVEGITFVREQDGQWHVWGYFLQDVYNASGAGAGTSGVLLGVAAAYTLIVLLFDWSNKRAFEKHFRGEEAEPPMGVTVRIALALVVGFFPFMNVLYDYQAFQEGGLKEIEQHFNFNFYLFTFFIPVGLLLLLFFSAIRVINDQRKIRLIAQNDELLPI